MYLLNLLLKLSRPGGRSATIAKNICLRQQPAILIKPATLLKLHKALVMKKYNCLFSNKNYKKPGRIGSNQEIIDLVLAYKNRNPLVRLLANCNANLKSIRH